MEGLIVEQKTSNTDLGDIFFQETNTPQIDLHQLLNAIKGAKSDDKILGIFIDLSDFLGGYPAELLKITNQLEDFKLSGKFIIAYSDFFSQSAYIIASPSTEIISYPSGGVLFQGFSSKRLFFKDFFDKIGLEVINLSEGQFKTAFENAFSLLFPIGEKAFIESVRNFEDQISDPKLLKEIKAFYGQEAAHRKVHQQYNEMLCDLRGYDLSLIHISEPHETDSYIVCRLLL